MAFFLHFFKIISNKSVSDNLDYEILKKDFNKESALFDVFRIPVVSETDAGEYECIADNGITPSISSKFTLTINGMHFIYKRLVIEVCPFKCVFLKLLTKCSIF